MKAELCPVCSGKGVVYGIGEAGAYPTITCHGCSGRGWVEVHEEPPTFWVGTPTTAGGSFG